MDVGVISMRYAKALLEYAAANKVEDEIYMEMLMLSHSFVELVLRERREGYVQSMSLMYIDLYRKLKNITIGRLITAYPVDKETEERMKEIVHNRTHGEVDFETKVDPSIEGGFIFEVDTYRLDASVATQLRRVKRQFIEKNRRIV